MLNSTKWRAIIKSVHKEGGNENAGFRFLNQFDEIPQTAGHDAGGTGGQAQRHAAGCFQMGKGRLPRW